MSIETMEEQEGIGSGPFTIWLHADWKDKDCLKWFHLDLYSREPPGNLRFQHYGTFDDWSEAKEQLKDLKMERRASLQEQTRKPLSPRLRYMVFRRDHYRCQICGASADDGAKLHVDHRTAVTHGGTNDESNLWTLCEACNLGKGALSL